MGLPCKFAQTLLIIHRAFGMLLLKEQGLRTKDPAHRLGLVGTRASDDEDPKGINH